MTPLLFKIILYSLFFAAVIALGSGFYFLMKDKGKRRRVANALLIRVTLCAILLGLMVYGYYAGYIGFTSPVGLVK